MTKVVMTRSDLFKASGILSAHCSSVGGFAVYEEGWSDERVAKETGDHLNVYHIRKLRLEAIGEIRSVTRAGTYEQLADLQSKYNDLILKHNKLVDSLSVNKVLDVRHLKVS